MPPDSLCGVSSRITDPEQLKELLGIPFTPEQTACITAPPAPQVIVAGAGSGKTTVMAARVVWLVGTGQVAPEQVLGLTFTNKAAGELAERVRKALVAAGVTDPDVIDPDNPRASPASPPTTPSPDGCSPTTACGSGSNPPPASSPTPPATSSPPGCCARPRAPTRH